eukprot:TRINITY_DN54969_c0_g1_i1.p1 TRINITY_DN54969_c0_g1~~TRINITY_DN54969_c0_g1_i1.p1  ORF type:complete len:274 (-),score=36.81 TRINITY_DN54969_c0_g1_i1:192-1013(-)
MDPTKHDVTHSDDDGSSSDEDSDATPRVLSGKLAGIREASSDDLKLKAALGLAVIGCCFVVALFFADKGQAAARGGKIFVADVSSVVNPRVFFDLEVDGDPVGRVEFELFPQIVPVTAENFRALATGERGVGASGRPLHYKGSRFHRIIQGFMCQGGDTTGGNGRGGESIYGHTFKDEWDRGVIQHTEPGLLSMANRGRHTNGGQFFITTVPARWLDGKHVVFGRVSRGMELVRMIESLGSPSGEPLRDVVIANSGELGHDSRPIQEVHGMEL